MLAVVTRQVVIMNLYIYFVKIWTFPSREWGFEVSLRTTLVTGLSGVREYHTICKAVQELKKFENPCSASMIVQAVGNL